MGSHPSDEAVDQLRLWHQNLHPIKLDIVGDFAGKELFAIHGESLVSHCVSKAQVDFGLGFQLLHAIHAVETFLANLKERGCYFHLLWFDQHEELCVPPQASKDAAFKYTLTRAVLMEHLGRVVNNGTNTPKLCYRFPCIDCEEFREYLATHAIHFIMCSDGASSDPKYERINIFYKHIVHEITRTGYCVAFINDIEFRSARVHARLLSPPRTVDALGFLEPPAREMAALNFSDLIESLKTAIQQFDPTATDSDGLTGKEITHLLALAAILNRDSDQDTRRRAAAFLVHTAVISRCQLSQRACSDPAALDNEANIFVERICKVASDILKVWDNDAFTSGAKWDCFDLIDGRIYSHILERLPHLCLTEQVVSTVSRLVGILEGLTSINLLGYLPFPSQRPSTPQHEFPQSVAEVSDVLRFSHPVVDEYLQDLNVTTVEDPKSTTRAQVFEDLTHWHNAKKLVDPKHRPPTPGFYTRRAYQRYMAEVMVYSASLTNSSGKIINRETINVQPPGKNKKLENKPVLPWKEDLLKKKNQTAKPINPKKKSGNGGQTNVHRTVQVPGNKKLEKRSESITNYWHQRCKKEFERETSLIKRYLAVTKYLSGLPEQDVDTIGGEVSLYICNTLAMLLNSGRSGHTEDMGIFAILWSQALDMRNLPLSREVCKHLGTFYKVFGMTINLQPRPSPIQLPLPFTGVIDRNLLSRPVLPTGSLNFQLEHCGPYMDRSFDSAPDPRVSFSPDAWQRKVLDAIDADHSLLVIAPTSAGKTFISFYAMKKILRESNEGVLVYVAPTKALVNQIAAEIEGRFSKTYPHGGKSVWAIYTRDYRVNNPLGCQILVTVPHILQIMLLAPSNAVGPTSWSRRVKRIIFDEVHSIGQAEDGVIWEQLLLLAPCPIIALSATIGNPEQFNSWLEGSQEAKGFKLTRVVHSSRYSDLRKFIYTPPKDFNFKGFVAPERLPLPGLGAGPENSSRFTFIHPVGAIVNRNRGALDDISLEPRDCLSLWNCISKHQIRDYSCEQSLEPKLNLPRLVTKSDVAKWETRLKAQLQNWMADPSSPFSSVCRELRPVIEPPPTSTATDEACISLTGISEATQGAPGSKLLPLLVDLGSQGALPALVFNYDRARCDQMVLDLLHHLQQAEETYKASSQKWKKKMAEYEESQRTNAKTKVKTASRVTSKRRDSDEPGPTKAELQRENASREANPWESFDPDAALPEFSFADTTKIPWKDLDDRISSLRKVKMNEDFILALRRGVGLHHAGLNRKYRQVVEILFRRGYLKVVIATGTLAMGINMPCKTVVFSGDSVYLTALNYRQASGRAGRRGFDILGNVVFHDIPPQRVFEIMSTRLPDLRGQFPTSVTLILRLFSLLHGTDNSEYAVKAMETLLSQTRLYLGGPSSQLAIKHHLRFSIDYLRRQYLLSPKGVPLNFAGLVGRMYFTENAAFAFHSLLKDGYFHELCADIGHRRSDVLLELVLVLCHLFCRIPCHQYKDARWLDQRVHRSPSIVLLPRLPCSAEAILRAHNRETLRIFQGYVSTFVNQHLSNTPDCELPFTAHRVGGPDTASDISCSLPRLPPTTVRSPFAALSGFTDEFETIGELCSGVRGGIFLEESTIPHIPIYPEETGGVPFNAYIYDFFKHGDLAALVRDNGIRRGDVWFRLKDFSLVLATIVTALANFLDPDAAVDEADMIHVQDAGDILEEGSEQDSGPGEDGDYKTQELPKLNIGAASPRKIKKKKTKVVESWDDESSSEDDTEESSSANGHSSPVASPSSAPSWEGEGKQGLPVVYRAFRMLQREFDEKFLKVWA